MGFKKNHQGICWKAWDFLCRQKDHGGLGFREFEIFNQAMLAKQFWRLHSRPNSLITHIFRARYFPHGNIWKATVGSYPSYGWRSVWGSKGLLRDGARWRIGDGKDIRVWEDAWLDGPGSGRVLSPRGVLQEGETVDMFIDADKNEWREELVRATFLPFEANKILSVPIGCCGSRDELCWVLSKDGILRVRDVYNHAISLKSFASASHGPDPVWARLWRLKVSPEGARIFTACFVGHRSSWG